MSICPQERAGASVSKKRQLDTSFWSDPWVVDSLNPLDRYLFLYLITNERTNIAGAYEISLRTIANETGIDKDEVVRMMAKMESRVIYADGWIILRKAIKNQNYKNPQISTGIIEILKHVPRSIFHYIYFPINWGEYVMKELGIDESCMTLDESSYYIIFYFILEKGDTKVSPKKVSSGLLKQTPTTEKTSTKQEDPLPLPNPVAAETPEVKEHNVSSEAVIWLYRLYIEKFNTTENRFKLTPKRRSKLETRIRDAGKSMIAEAIARTARSPHHRGDNNSGWKADLDWILRSYEQVERLANLELKRGPSADVALDEHERLREKQRQLWRPRQHQQRQRGTLRNR